MAISETRTTWVRSHQKSKPLLILVRFTMLTYILGDIPLLNLVINIGSLGISAACLRAFPEFIVLTEKRAYLLSNWRKKHSTFNKRSVADLVNGFDVPGISVSISKVDLVWRRLFIAYCPVVAKCSKRSLTRCNSSDLSHKNSNFDAM